MSHQDPSVPPNAAGDTPESLVAEARRLTDERRFERAIGRLSEALEVDPERLDWLSFRANLLQIAARHEEALADLEKVLDRTPTDEAAWRNLAHSRLVLGRVDQRRE